MGAATELDAHIPTGLRAVDALNQKIGNDFTGLSGAWLRVRTRRTLPLISVRQRHFVSSNRRWSVCAFFHVELLELVLKRHVPIKKETRLQWEPDVARIAVFNLNLVFDRAMF